MMMVVLSLEFEFCRFPALQIDLPHKPCFGERGQISIYGIETYMRMFDFDGCMNLLHSEGVITFDNSFQNFDSLRREAITQILDLL